MLRRESDDVDFLRRCLIVVGIVALAALVWLLSDVLLLVFASVLFALILRSLSEPLARHTRLTAGWSLALVTLLLVSLSLLVFWLFGSEIIAQSRELTRILPEAWESFRERYGLWNLDQQVRQQAESANASILFSVAGWVISAGAVILNVFLVLIGGLYIAAAPDLYRNGVLLLFPKAERQLASETMEVSGQALRLWLVGQFGAMALVGIVTATGLWLLGLPAPLALGLLAALAEFVPVVGPIAAALPALLLAAGSGLEMMLWTAALYIFVQQAENNIIVPLLQHRTVSLPPALTLFALLAAGVVLGPLGVILAAPLTVLVYVAVKKLYVRETLGEKTPVPGETLDEKPAAKRKRRPSTTKAG